MSQIFPGCVGLGVYISNDTPIQVATWFAGLVQDENTVPGSKITKNYYKMAPAESYTKRGHLCEWVLHF